MRVTEILLLLYLLSVLGCYPVTPTAIPTPNTQPPVVVPAPDPLPPTDPTTLPSPAPSTAQQLLRLHNEARGSKSPLALSAKLAEAAQDHAAWMAEHHKMSHTGANSSDVSDRLVDVGYNWSACGENIAEGYRGPEEVVHGWMNSPGHRRNILGPYLEVGFGVSRGSNGALYWCADFGVSRRGQEPRMFTAGPDVPPGLGPPKEEPVGKYDGQQEHAEP